MDITPVPITVEELAAGFVDNDEAGVVGYGGHLDIRPPYQREFVYKDRQRDAVIDTLIKNFPLNVMYWAVRDDGDFEIIDGQQRTISICRYIKGDFSYMGRYFHNLQADEKKSLLEYQLTVYRCSGTDSDKLAWFKTINIAGEKLTDQELRNAVYAGSWLAAAKPIFSKTNCPAYGLGKDYLDGSPIRQVYLETVLDWLSDGNVEDYMARHQHDSDASKEWKYFQDVISWVQATFPTYRREMKSVRWGTLYNSFSDAIQETLKLEARVAQLMEDEAVSNKSGIFDYVLTGNERSLNIRAFSRKQKREAFERQGGRCAKCGEEFALTDMEADHITPWSRGGPTTAANCQLLCKDDNRRKSDN